MEPQSQLPKKHGVIIEEIDYSRIRRYGNIEDLNRQDDLAFKFYMCKLIYVEGTNISSNVCLRA